MRVLVVEAEESALKRATRVLTGVDIVEARAVAHAVEALGDPTIDAVLLALNMPGHAGLDALRAVMDAAGRTPILVVADVDDGQLVREAIRNGAGGYVARADLSDGGVERVLLQVYAAVHNGRPSVVEELHALLSDQPQEARIEWLIAALSQSIELVAEGLSTLDTFLVASRNLLERGQGAVPILALQPEIVRLLQALEPVQDTLSRLAAVELQRRASAERRAALRLKLAEIVTSKPFLHVVSAAGGAAAVVFAKYLGLDLGE